jgi:TonB family protein
MNGWAASDEAVTPKRGGDVFRLIESRKERRRQRGATLFSVTAHTAVILALVAANASGKETATSEPTPKPPIYIPVDPRPAAPDAPPVGPATPAPSPTTPPITVPPIDIPTRIPPIGEPISVDPVIGRPSDPSTGTTGPALGTPFGRTIRDTTAAWAHEVDRPATPLGKSRVPRYPGLLQSARQEGSVVAFFVVDTMGRVEPASFRTASSTHTLFTESVRSAVLAMRFRPAEVAGHPVRQLVEQRFIFTLTP